MGDKKIKEPFKFSYNVPSLDWYETKNVTINPEDYYYFTLERRFGPSWWLVGKNLKEKPNYHWETEQIGELERPSDLIKFIKWAETEKGSKITEVRAISGDFNIIKEILKLGKSLEEKED